MNLDLLIKLVKLANNNPSENEANLAARKVCKIIEENKFVFTDTKEPPHVPPRTYSRGRSPFAGFDWDSRFYDEFFRNAEASRKEREETRRKAEEERRKQQEEERKKQQEQPRYRKYDGREWFTGYGPERNTPRSEPDYFGKSRKEGKERTCSKCGVTIKTFNTKEPYVCSFCFIKEYDK